MHRWFDISAAERDLKYEPIVPYSVGWPDTLVWFKAHWLPTFDQRVGSSRRPRRHIRAHHGTHLSRPLPRGVRSARVPSFHSEYRLQTQRLLAAVPIGGRAMPLGTAFGDWPRTAFGNWLRAAVGGLAGDCIWILTRPPLALARARLLWHHAVRCAPYRTHKTQNLTDTPARILYSDRTLTRPSGAGGTHGHRAAVADEDRRAGSWHGQDEGAVGERGAWRWRGEGRGVVPPGRRGRCAQHLFHGYKSAA